MPRLMVQRSAIRAWYGVYLMIISWISVGRLRKRYGPGCGEDMVAAVIQSSELTSYRNMMSDAVNKMSAVLGFAKDKYHQCPVIHQGVVRRKEKRSDDSDAGFQGNKATEGENVTTTE